MAPFAGAVRDTVVGGTSGVTGVLVLATLTPPPELAVTTQLYAVPPTRPVTVIDVAVGPAVAVTVGLPAAVQVAVYSVIGEPPLLLGAVMFSVTLLGPAVLEVRVGADGGPISCRAV